MAKGVNKVLLLGNVGKDPEIRATARRHDRRQLLAWPPLNAPKDQQGNWTDKTEWHNLVCLRAHRRNRSRLRQKRHAAVYRRQDSRPAPGMTKSPARRRYRTEILVNEMSLLGGRGASEGGGSSERSSGSGYSGSRSSSGSGAPSGGYSQPSNDYADQGITDEDIPF